MPEVADPRELTLDEQLRALAEPIRERLAEVEKSLATAQALVDGLRADRAKVRKALAAVDPTYVHPNKPGPKGSKHRKGSDGKQLPYSEAAVDKAAEVMAELRPTLNGDEFTGAEIARRAEWPFSGSYTAVLFTVLHERGVLRLVKRGKGGSKIYAVV